MSLEELFPKELIENNGFLETIKRVLSVDRKYLPALRDNLPEHPVQMKDEQFVEDAANSVGMSETEYRSIAVGMRMMTSSAATGKATAHEVVEYLSGLVGVSLDEESRAAFEAFVHEVAQDQGPANEVRAFSYGDTFANMEFQPLIVPHPQDEAVGLYFGGSLLIGYVDNSAQRRAISFNISLPELRSLVAGLERELQALEGIRARVTGGQ